MLRAIILGISFCMAEVCLAEEAAPTLHQRVILVGFIRVGADDAHSLVVLKTRDSGRTMILRSDDAIPGTAYKIVSLGRDELRVLGPDGKETLALESESAIERSPVDAFAAAQSLNSALAVSEGNSAEPETPRDANQLRDGLRATLPLRSESKLGEEGARSQRAAELPCVDASCLKGQNSVREAESLPAETYETPID